MKAPEKKGKTTMLRGVGGRVAHLGALLLALGCASEAEDNSADVMRQLAQAAVITPKSPAPAAVDSRAFNPRLLRRFQPARETIKGDAGDPSEALVDLGRMLYYEKRLSKNQELSCNSCHRLERYGVDSEQTSEGDHGQRGVRNAPTVYHAAAQFEQFWDGRTADVETQALGPILNPMEMAASSPEYVTKVLESMPAYVAAFGQAFPTERTPIVFINVGKAIGAFERGLTTRSRWDDFLEGNKTALSGQELLGLKLFTNLGCMVCHTGELLGGSMYEKVGTVEPWPNQSDPGRYAITQLEGDRMLFKVPTLRNISETAPYFHDGRVDSLDQAVRLMGKHQLGLELHQGEVAAIVSWLRSLKGDLPQKYIAEPVLPPSTLRTPKPGTS